MTTMPFRMCVGCRQVRPKDVLVRLVRDADGAVTVDPRRRAPGRGAYVCADMVCVERALKGSRLAHAFRKPCRVVVDVRMAVSVLEVRAPASPAPSIPGRPDGGYREERGRSPDLTRR